MPPLVNCQRVALSTGKSATWFREFPTQNGWEEHSLIRANTVIEVTSTDSLHLSEAAGFKNSHSAILSYPVMVFYLTWV